jgi:hypothetical protein
MALFQTDISSTKLNVFYFAYKASCFRDGFLATKPQTLLGISIRVPKRPNLNRDSITYEY